MYEREVRFPLECLVAELSDPAHALPLRGDPKRAVFRVYRDVRFSKDKSPYKTHAAAYLARGGVRGDPGDLYIHIEPKKCFLGAGFFMPDSAPRRGSSRNEPGTSISSAPPPATRWSMNSGYPGIAARPRMRRQQPERHSRRRQ